MFFRLAGIIFVFSASGCAREPLDVVADRYVELALALDAHDPGTVDVDLGRSRAAVGPLTLTTLESRANRLLAQLESLPPNARRRFLRGQLRALAARVRILQGVTMTLDEELRALYDIAPPAVSENDARPILDELDRLLPGEGSLVSRYAAYQKEHLVLAAELDGRARDALKECRRRTLSHIAIPTGEFVEVELVRGKPWASYHQYRGSLSSVVQVNRDVAWTERALLEAVCHESYPGHHLSSILADTELVHKRGLPEYSIQTLHSPYGMRLERLASFGARLVLDEDASEIEKLTFRLRPFAAEGARRYLEGRSDRVATVIWLEEHAMMPDAWAFLRFVDRYRGYVFAYAYGDEPKPPHGWDALSKMLIGLDDTT